MRVSRPNMAPPLAWETHGELNHRPGATLSAGSQIVLPTVRFSSATTVVFITAANKARCDVIRKRDGLRHGHIWSCSTQPSHQHRLKAEHSFRPAMVFLPRDSRGDRNIASQVTRWRKRLSFLALDGMLCAIHSSADLDASGDRSLASRGWATVLVTQRSPRAMASPHRSPVPTKEEGW